MIAIKRLAEKVGQQNKSAKNQETLTDLEFSKLRKVNDRLCILELKIKSEIVKIQNQLNKRLQTKDTFLSDYEIELKIFLILKKDDPEHSDDEDNFLVEFIFTVFKDGEIELGGEENFNFFKQFENNSMQKDHHCRLFFCLYDKAMLSW